MHTRNQIIDDCKAVLDQSAILIARMTDDVFTTTTPMSPRGSIGGHLRHVLDFYRNFLSGIEQGKIDYNQRERNTPIEHDRFFAVERIRSTMDQFAELSALNLHEHLLVSGECDDSWSRSSIKRELDFLLSHTIHHYSLIAMILRLHEIDPGEEFGVAPSTLKHWRQETVCAQ